MCNQCRYLWSWRVKSFTLLAYLVALIESKAYFVPASHSVTTIGDGGYEDQAAQQANDYAVREGSESSIIPSIQPADLGFFSSGGYGVKKKRKFIDNYNFGVPFKDHYDEYPMLPSPPIALEHIKSSDNRGVQHTNTKLAHIGSIIASTLKYMLITMLVIGVPALFIHYVVIPLKLLIGLKMLALANAVTLGTLAAKHMIKDKHGSGGHGYGSGNGGGGSGGSTIGGLLGGLSAISTPIVAPNIQQPITQPITQLVSNPTQQLQNVETFNSFPYWFPLLLYYANLTSGSGSNSNSNSNSNTNTNSNSNTNTNTNTNTNNNQNNNNNHNNNNNNNHNNNHNHNHNNNNNNNNERIKLPTKLRKTKILGIEPLQTEDFKNMTEGDVRAVMTFLKRKNKKVMIL